MQYRLACPAIQQTALQLSTRNLGTSSDNYAKAIKGLDDIGKTLEKVEALSSKVTQSITDVIKTIGALDNRINSNAAALGSFDTALNTMMTRVDTSI